MRNLQNQPSLSCKKCPESTKTHVFTAEIIEYLPEVIQSLENGDSFFYFSCKPGLNHTENQKQLIDKIINITSLVSEKNENNVPFVNIYTSDDAEKYTVLVTQAIYLLPNLKEEFIRPEFLASADYHRNCQPKGTIIHENDSKGTTIRFTKSIIKYIYKLTVQFKVSLIPQSTLKSLSSLLGCAFSRGILLERTKKDPTKLDSTAKVKSVLLYRPVDDGFLVHNVTIVLNTFIPSIVAPIIQTFNRGGVHEVKETVENTRLYINTIANAHS